MSTLDKHRQKFLFGWLKQQARLQRRLLFTSVLTGFLAACCIVIQALLLATILHKLVMEEGQFMTILPYLIGLILAFIIRAMIIFYREQINYKMGCQIREDMRKKITNKINKEGPATLNSQTMGSWSTLFIEQIEDIQDFYARYLPQMRLASLVPILVLIAILPFNWAAALILFCTAPLIPLFMVLVGMGAADVNRRNFAALSHLSGHFLDRLKGLRTIRLFSQGATQAIEIEKASNTFRERTMSVLKMAFLSSGVLEFFTSISIAIVAVYFGFSYLGEFNFGSYDQTVTLFAGFFALILAPEFFQPLRDLGTFYHAKAQAIAAADNIESYLSSENQIINDETKTVVNFNETIQTIVADKLTILSPQGSVLAGPISFSIKAPFRLALLGKSGEGKTSLMNVLLKFLSYQGSLKINGIELNHISEESWRAQISWLGQNPYLLNTTIKQNILLAKPDASNDEIYTVLQQVQLMPFINTLPDGIDTILGEEAVRVSVGQAQRIAIARALLKPCQLLLLDEPTASLDKRTALEIDHILQRSYQDKQVITITHQANDLSPYTQVWHLQNQQIIQQQEPTGD